MDFSTFFRFSWKFCKFFPRLSQLFRKFLTYNYGLKPYHLRRGVKKTYAGGTVLTQDTTVRLFPRRSQVIHLTQVFVLDTECEFIGRCYLAIKVLKEI